jgi:hypothetical protein
LALARQAIDRTCIDPPLPPTPLRRQSTRGDALADRIGAHAKSSSRLKDGQARGHFHGQNAIADKSILSKIGVFTQRPRQDSNLRPAD